MKVILAVVISADGKTTKWHEKNIYKWTSPEDQQYFFSLIEENNVIIMGRKTFFAAKPYINLSPEKLRIVITQSPKKYAKIAIPGQLEFKNLDPETILAELAKRGFKQILLVSGSQISTLFLQKKLVDELWMTIEPKIFGKGNKMIKEEKLDIKLQIKTIKQMNKEGTLLIKYLLI